MEIFVSDRVVDFCIVITYVCKGEWDSTSYYSSLIGDRTFCKDKEDIIIFIVMEVMDEVMKQTSDRAGCVSVLDFFVSIYIHWTVLSYNSQSIVVLELLLNIPARFFCYFSLLLVSLISLWICDCLNSSSLGCFCFWIKWKNKYPSYLVICTLYNIVLYPCSALLSIFNFHK